MGDEVLRRRSPPIEAISEEPICRICFDAGNLENCCACRGSLAFVHPSCLLRWRGRSPLIIGERCELCGARYRVPGPLGCISGATYAAGLTGLLILWLAWLQVVGQVFGEVLPTAKICGRGHFTAPWRRSLQHLFNATDLDADGGLSFVEMRKLADTTGENVSDRVLNLALQYADHDSRGLTFEGLVQSYEYGNGDVLWADLETYGLAHTLKSQDGDFSMIGLFFVALFALASSIHAWPLGLLSLLGKWERLTVVFMVLAACPWRCRLIPGMLGIVGFHGWAVDWLLVLEDEADSKVTDASFTDDVERRRLARLRCVLALLVAGGVVLIFV
eukprot:TRINITY_DN63032_c0_g1_i1.p1 TRINITY_DN63032_c0_g1~~TRINITY_DN63032_c0_g1_i1.p1  ORF type:complete len:331 (-),score=40.99 TRINITY_DN63032_c0_g1_i1:70-1062(-)